MYPYIQGETITALGFGGGFALWGIRAIVSGKGKCCRLNAGFDRAFAIDNVMDKTLATQTNRRAGCFAMNAMKSFCYQLGTLGRREIVISSPGTMGVTADELSIVSILAGGQAGDKDRCEAHLCWLLATNETQLAYRAAQTYGELCNHAGIEIKGAESISDCPGRPAARLKVVRVG